MDIDYRNTEYCPVLDLVAEEKAKLEKQIKEDSPTTRIMYNKVNKKDGTYFAGFSKIYNYKCAYCGASMRFTNMQLFEVDHFICESSFGNDTASKANAGKLSNLVFSCFTCNRGKHDLLIEGNYCKMLNPDDSSILEVFYRDQEYYIKIKDKYENDIIIKDFYDKLKLGFQTRRLDYLLMEMKGLVNEVRDKNLKYEMESAIEKLMEKKNYTSGYK